LANCYPWGNHVSDDSSHYFLDSTLYFGRNLCPGFESPSLDSIDPESRWKAIQNVSQFNGFCHAKAMGRSSCVDRGERLPAVPCLHRADRCSGHRCVDHYHIVGTVPGLDEIRGVANVSIRFNAKLPQSLRD
jgi:hypothetical protein